MEIRKLPVLFSLLFVFTSGWLNGQSLLDKANKQYELKAYDLALENFKLAYKEDRTCWDCMFKIAECYQYVNNNLEAYNWYSRLDGLYKKPAYFLSFGKLLKKLGKYEEASDKFTQYAGFDRPLGLHYAQSCDFALDLIGKADHRQVELCSMNSQEDDFSPTLVNGDLVFASFRTDIDKSASRDYSLLYKNQNDRVCLLQDAFLGDINVTSASFDKDMQTCAYFKHNFVNGLQHLSSNDQNQAIFFSKVDGRVNFLKETPYPHNSLEFANAYPFLTEGGDAMIYSSNMPGGQGGFDLYISYHTEAGWTEPINLGPEINTPGNEICPMQSANQLFFASDYHFGLGGYDIFSADYMNGIYGNVINLEKGINSPEDDFYPFYDLDKDEFYFSSNRMGGKGKIDIYLATGSEEQDYMVTTELPAKVDVKPEAFVLEEKFDVEPKFQDVAYVENTAAASEDHAIVHANYNAAKKYEDAPKAVEIASVDFSSVYVGAKLPEDLEEASFVDYGISTNRKSAANRYEEIAEVAITTKEDHSDVTGAVRVDAEVEEKPAELVPAPVMEKRVENNEKAFFIQLGAFRETNGDLNRYGSLINFGSLFKVEESGVTKIKLGYFHSRNQAELVLNQVRSEGYRDAFITHSFIQSGITSSSTPSDYGSESNAYTEVELVDTAPVVEYKVRLASYEDPIWFDVNKAKGIGNIEQWSKGKWTIFVLGGYSSFENANAALSSAVANGFKDARVVLDDNGILKEIN